MTTREPQAYMIFGSSGPLLVLSTYDDITDEDLIGKFRYKGIEKFLAYEISLDAVKKAYATTYDGVVADLEDENGITVLDFSGHHIMANFSLGELGDPIRFDG